MDFLIDSINVHLRTLFAALPISALFLSLAAGYTIGKIQFGRFQLGGLAGTLFAAIIIGQVGVEVDNNIKTMSFAVFIYTLGYVSGPQFFQSLGRTTLDQLHLTVFAGVMIFVTVWCAARFFDLDPGSAAGLLAGATTESASVGTAGDAIANLKITEEEKLRLQSNIAVTYAITYLFGFTLVIFFTTKIAPRLMGVNLQQASREFEDAMGGTAKDLEDGQSEPLQEVRARLYRLTEKRFIGSTVAYIRESSKEAVHVVQLYRGDGQIKISPTTRLERGDLVALMGSRTALASCGPQLGAEEGTVDGIELIDETRDVVVTTKKLSGITLAEAKQVVDPAIRRGVFVLRLKRADRELKIWRGVMLQPGDVVTLYGPRDSVDKTARDIGYSVDPSKGVDYVYLGVGIIVGMIIGLITVPVAGADLGLHTGGGCLISGLVFGWLRARKPTFGSLPATTALHLRDYGLAIFIASVGLASGPHALTLLEEKGMLLPLLALITVSVPLLTCTLYAHRVLKMPPPVICGALAGVLTCTPALNALVSEADSEAPVFGYTVPYAVSNVILTLLGPVIVLAV
ncbi:MAG: aspartate-alanine antiporter [Halieaceae bacterium]|nr:aspartate-alanine antiporter [Halieaceae bacterium]